ncbi:hypothetical protein GO497_09200 [Acidovorax citrulli]|nr:hypothetical protein [Paracidovorax citrulli]
MSEYLSAEEGLKKIIAQRVEQANDLYALLGEFVVSFELLCQEMRQQLALLCAPAPHRQSDIFALTGEMTAAPLLSSYRRHGSSLPRRGQAVFQSSLYPNSEDHGAKEQYRSRHLVCGLGKRPYVNVFRCAWCEDQELQLGTERCEHDSL